MKKTFILTLLTSLCLTGCLDYQMRHTLYLEPGGEVSWVLHFRQTQLADNAAKQDALLAELLAGDHDVAEALWDLGALEVETTVIRERAPLAFTVQAVFPTIDPVLEALFEDWHAISWQDDWDPSGGRRLYFRVDAREDGAPEDFPVIELVPVGGKLFIDGQEAVSGGFDEPEDWRFLEVFWPVEELEARNLPPSK